jgi:uncharacterized protein YbaR (Trm112 family)/ubiquinone/menaquinone biosynthesis C-methylase UbiE
MGNAVEVNEGSFPRLSLDFGHFE